MLTETNPHSWDRPSTRPTSVCSGMSRSCFFSPDTQSSDTGTRPKGGGQLGTHAHSSCAPWAQAMGVSSPCNMALSCAVKSTGCAVSIPTDRVQTQTMLRGPTSNGSTHIQWLKTREQTHNIPDKYLRKCYWYDHFKVHNRWVWPLKLNMKKKWKSLNSYFYLEIRQKQNVKYCGKCCVHTDLLLLFCHINQNIKHPGLLSFLLIHLQEFIGQTCIISGSEAAAG